LLAAWSLGVVAMVGIPARSCSAALSRSLTARDHVVGELRRLHDLLRRTARCWAPCRRRPLLWLMVLSQGGLGYAFAAMMGPIVARDLRGRTLRLDLSAC
jgi:hypothetical protein